MQSMRINCCQIYTKHEKNYPTETGCTLHKNNICILFIKFSPSLGIKVSMMHTNPRGAWYFSICF